MIDALDQLIAETPAAAPAPAAAEPDALDHFIASTPAAAATPAPQDDNPANPPNAYEGEGDPLDHLIASTPAAAPMTASGQWDAMVKSNPRTPDMTPDEQSHLDGLWADAGHVIGRNPGMSAQDVEAQLRTMGYSPAQIANSRVHLREMAKRAEADPLTPDGRAAVDLYNRMWAQGTPLRGFDVTAYQKRGQSPLGPAGPTMTQSPTEPEQIPQQPPGLSQQERDEDAIYQRNGWTRGTPPPAGTTTLTPQQRQQLQRIATHQQQEPDDAGVRVPNLHPGMSWAELSAQDPERTAAQDAQERAYQTWQDRGQPTGWTGAAKSVGYDVKGAAVGVAQSWGQWAGGLASPQSAAEINGYWAQQAAANPVVDPGIRTLGSGVAIASKLAAASKAGPLAPLIFGVDGAGSYKATYGPVLQQQVDAGQITQQQADDRLSSGAAKAGAVSAFTYFLLPQLPPAAAGTGAELARQLGMQSWQMFAAGAKMTAIESAATAMIAHQDVGTPLPDLADVAKQSVISGGVFAIMHAVGVLQDPNVPVRDQLQELGLPETAGPLLAKIRTADQAVRSGKVSEADAQRWIVEHLTPQDLAHVQPAVIATTRAMRDRANLPPEAAPMTAKVAAMMQDVATGAKPYDQALRDFEATLSPADHQFLRQTAHRWAAEPEGEQPRNYDPERRPDRQLGDEQTTQADKPYAALPDDGTNPLSVQLENLQGPKAQQRGPAIVGRQPGPTAADPFEAGNYRPVQPIQSLTGPFDQEASDATNRSVLSAAVERRPNAGADAAGPPARPARASGSAAAESIGTGPDGQPGTAEALPARTAAQGEVPWTQAPPASDVTADLRALQEHLRDGGGLVDSTGYSPERPEQLRLGRGGGIEMDERGRWVGLGQEDVDDLLSQVRRRRMSAALPEDEGGPLEPVQRRELATAQPAAEGEGTRLQAALGSDVARNGDYDAQALLDRFAQRFGGGKFTRSVRDYLFSTNFTAEAVDAAMGREGATGALVKAGLLSRNPDTGYYVLNHAAFPQYAPQAALPAAAASPVGDVAQLDRLLDTRIPANDSRGQVNAHAGWTLQQSMQDSFSRGIPDVKRWAQFAPSTAAALGDRGPALWARAQQRAGGTAQSPPPTGDATTGGGGAIEQQLAGIRRRADARDLQDSMRSLSGVGRIGDQMPAAAAAQFDAHGVAGGLPSLAKLLREGIDPGRPFHTAQLNDPAGGMGLRDASHFVVVSKPGQSLKAGGIHAVIADGLYAPEIPQLRKLYPGVQFLSRNQAAQALAARAAAPAGRPAAGARLAPAAAAAPSQSLADAWLQLKADGGTAAHEQYAARNIRPIEQALAGGTWKSLAELPAKGNAATKARLGEHLNDLADSGHLQRAWDGAGELHYAAPGAAMPAWLNQSDHPPAAAKPAAAPAAEPPALRTPQDVGPAFSEGRRKIGRSILPPGLVAIDNPATAAEALRELAAYATRPGALAGKASENRGVVYRVVGPEEAEKYKAATGLDLKGYAHVADGYAAKHIAQEHADGQGELLRGQVPLTPEDFALVPQVTRPENITGKRMSDGVLRIEYQKDIGGRMLAVEEVRNKRNQLALQTAYKWKDSGGHVSDALPSSPGDQPSSESTHLTPEATDRTPLSSTDSIGAPPAPVKPQSPTIDGKPVTRHSFTRSALERELMRAHEADGHGYTADDERALADAAAGGNAWKFHGEQLPGEVRDYIEGNPAARKLFKLTANRAEAGGEDSMAELGQRYWDIADSLTAKPRRAMVAEALASARNSNDAQRQLMAAVYDNLPPKGEKRPAQEVRDPKTFPTGTTFELNGHQMRIVEDEDGYRMLRDGDDYPVLPVDQLDAVPVDKNTILQAKEPELPEGDFVPAGRGGDFFDADAAGSSGEQRGIFGQPEYFGATGRSQGKLEYETEGQPVPGAARDDAGASASATDPAHTAAMFGDDDEPTPLHRQIQAAMAAQDERALGKLVIRSMEGRAYFREQTGIKLPVNVRDAQDAIDSWARGGWTGAPPAAAGEAAKPGDVQRGDASSAYEVSDDELQRMMGTLAADPDRTGGTIIGQKLPEAPAPAGAHWADVPGGPGGGEPGDGGGPGGFFGSAADGAKALWRHVADTAKEISGQMYPRTTRRSRLAGEAMARYVASEIYAREAAPLAAEEIIGKPQGKTWSGQDWGIDPELDAKAGAVLVEDNLRDVANQLHREGDLASSARVRSIVGGPGSPFETQADFGKALHSPEVQAVIERYRAWFSGEPEANYRASQGVAPEDELPTRGQQTGARVNLITIAPGEPTPKGAVGAVARGRAGAAIERNSPFAKKAFGTGDVYDVRLSRMIENTLMRGTANANLHRVYDTLVREGLAVRGSGADHPTIGGQPTAALKIREHGQDQTLHVLREIYPELRNALNVDAAPPSKIIRGIAGVANQIALASMAEGLTHLANTIGPLYRAPGGVLNLARWLKRGGQLLNADPEARAALARMAQIAALKPHSPDLTGRSRFNPLLMISHNFGTLIEGATRAGRLAMNDAFDQAAKAGMIEDTETNRRDFINQLGQYQARGQHWLIRFFRDTGIGPFATASTNFAAFGIRGVALSPRLKAANLGSAVRLRLGILGGVMAAAAAVALYNWLHWGRADGGSSVPYGSIRLANDDQGRTRYFDVLRLLGISRGLRDTGAMATIEGRRRGMSASEIGDKAAHDLTSAAVAPFAGPLVQDLAIALTGRDATGHRVAPKAAPGRSQLWENLKAAAKSANPTVDKLTGGHAGASWLGPFGPHTTETPERSTAADLAHRLAASDRGDRAYTEAENQQYAAKRALLDALRTATAAGDVPGQRKAYAELQAAERAGQITRGVMTRIASDARQSALQVDVGHLAAGPAMQVWRAAVDDGDTKQLEQLLPVIGQKLVRQLNAGTLPRPTFDAYSAELRAHGPAARKAG